MYWAEQTEEQRLAYEEWCAERPEAIRVVAEKFCPQKLYRIKSTGQRVIIESYFEPDEEHGVTLRVTVHPAFNPERFDIVPFGVYGIKPEDLEECDLPVITTQPMYEGTFTVTEIDEEGGTVTINAAPPKPNTEPR